MKNSGKALFAAFRIIGVAGAAVLLLLAATFLGRIIGAFVVPRLFGVQVGLDSAFTGMPDCLVWILISLWVLFSGFTLYFFRDPDPLVPTAANLVVSPGHGQVDAIDTATEPEFMGGECQRISIFLSVISVHVQCAPAAGRVAFFKHSPGQYFSALRAESAQFNENVLIGLEAAEPRGEKIGVRLIAGVIARRIVPWVREDDTVQRGERISLIQFGSRVDVYLPRRAKVRVKPGDKVVGGETMIASFD